MILSKQMIYSLERRDGSFLDSFRNLECTECLKGGFFYTCSSSFPKGRVSSTASLDRRRG
jgi:hypothetical protein